MSINKTIAKFKRWLYAIPAVHWLRLQHSYIHAWNRWVGYLVNWLGHYAVCWAVVAVFSIPPLIHSGLMAGWIGAVIGASVALLFYSLSELHGVIRRSTAPWWDHVGDLIGPVVCFFQVWSMRP